MNDLSSLAGRWQGEMFECAAAAAGVGYGDPTSKEEEDACR